MRRMHKLHEDGNPDKQNRPWTGPDWLKACDSLQLEEHSWGRADHGGKRVVRKAQRSARKRPASAARTRIPACENAAINDDVCDEQVVEKQKDAFVLVENLLRWIAAVHLAVGGITSIGTAMMTSQGATWVCEWLGFSPFCCVLAVRFLQLFGWCKGENRFFGSGAFWYGNRLVYIDDENTSPPADRMYDLYLLLEPVLKYYVCFHLGPEWSILITYQLFQGLCCEMRKEHDRRYSRRADPESRRPVYAAQEIPKMAQEDPKMGPRWANAAPR